MALMIKRLMGYIFQNWRCVTIRCYSAIFHVHKNVFWCL